MAQPYLPGQVLLAAAVPDYDLLWREAPPRRPHLVVPIFETDGGLIAVVPVTVTPETAMQQITVAVRDELDVAQVAVDAFITGRLVEYSGEVMSQLYMGSPKEGWPADVEEFDVDGGLPHGLQLADFARQ